MSNAHTTPAALRNLPSVNAARFAFKNRGTVSLVQCEDLAHLPEDRDPPQYLINRRTPVVFEGDHIVANGRRYRAVAQARGRGKWFLMEV